MKKILIVALLLGCCVVAAAQDDKTPANDPPYDTQDVLYLGEGRPAILRLHLQVDGKPVFVIWETWMKRFFAYLDRNDSGGLDRVEGGKSPSPQQVMQFLQGDLATL